MASQNSTALIETSVPHRYHFNLLGTVKEILYPNKAIVHFKLNGMDERAILLSKMFHLNGKPLDESQATKQPITDFIKVNEMLHFDCHIYDKMGVGCGKDKCNYFVMKARKHSEVCHQNALKSATSLRTATGWVSEIHPHHGVITYSYNGVDQRASFHASRIFLYEKRLGLRHSLLLLLSLGEQVQFEAVPSESGCSGNIAVDFCPMSAILVWKGKRPSIDPFSLDNSPGTIVNNVVSYETNGTGVMSSTVIAPAGASISRKGSVDSSSSSDAASDDTFNASADSGGAFLIIPSSANKNQVEVIRGVGMIAKIMSEDSGVIWWLRRPNHSLSVWFEAKKTFKYGFNLCDQNLYDYVKEGEFAFALLSLKGE